MKKIYKWVINWAHTPYASVAIFLVAFAESIFFPMPADILLIVLVLGYREKAFRYALYCTVGSVTGALVGYSLGHNIWVNPNGEFSWFANLFFENIPGFSVAVFDRMKVLFEQWNFWIIFLAGFTPVPYKIFTITAGVFDLNLFIFILSAVISKGARYFLLTFLLWKYGNPVKSFLDRYYRIIAFGFTICLVGGFVIVRFLL